MDEEREDLPPRDQRLGPGGLDPVEVMDMLPKELQVGILPPPLSPSPPPSPPSPPSPPPSPPPPLPHLHLFPPCTRLLFSIYYFLLNEIIILLYHSKINCLLPYPSLLSFYSISTGSFREQGR